MKRVVITGGASGLGKAMAEYYAAQGWSVCIADIQRDAGEELARELGEKYRSKCFFFRLDVTSDQDWKSLVADILVYWGGADLLINNAGVAASGDLEQMQLSNFAWTLDINLMGVVRGCYHFIPLLKESRGGVINIASMAGLLHMGGMSAYNASKAAVVALSETLHAELSPQQVRVMVVCPAFFRTNLTDNMRSAEQSGTALANDLMNKSNLTSEDIARSVFQAYEHGDFMLLPHKRERRVWLIKRLFPSFYLRLIVGAAERLKAKIAT